MLYDIYMVDDYNKDTEKFPASSSLKKVGGVVLILCYVFIGTCECEYSFDSLGVSFILKCPECMFSGFLKP